MNNKYIFILLGLIVVLVSGYFLFNSNTESVLDATPNEVSLTGTYVCLPHSEVSDLETEECVFGLNTDSGDYYAVDFGQSENSADQFQSGKKVTLKGVVVIKEALSSDFWAKYNMKGIISVSSEESQPPIKGKININEVCQNALSYMSFQSGMEADIFVGECVEGKHPEVVEKYLEQMGLGDGSAM